MTRDVWDVLFLSFLSFLSAMPLFVNTSFPYSSQRPSHASECNVLLQFSQSFTISRDASAFYCDILRSANTSYPKAASWKNDTNCCSWDGVTCHKSKDYVIRLDLSCSWLQGTLHSISTLFSLRNLQWLNLAGNNFSGSQISSRFGILTGLAYLNLSGSSFSGIIPLEMISHHLSNLISLDLSSGYNRFFSPSDKIPFGPTGNFGLIVEEDRSFRRFISNLTQLRELALDSVDMSRVSLTSFMNLSSTLTSLSLGGCFLQGTFPIDIFHLPNLRSLSLFGNSNLTGTLPQTNWSSSPLVRLGLSKTKFHGPIPDSVGNLTSLEHLVLLDNEFTGSVPPTLGNLDRLSSLALGGDILSGTVDFDTFARLKNLEYIYLQSNLNIMLPNNGNRSFPRLKGLSLRGVGLTSAFPYFLRSSPKLTDLDLSSNNFIGTIPSSICQLSSLRYLSLSNNQLKGTIPRCLGNLSSLSYLDLANNGIHDTFPHWLLNANHALEFLDLWSNMFHGVINEIPLPPQLKVLSLSNNQFAGQLPTVFFRNSNVELVDLANNNFDGPLPIPPPNVWFYSVANNKFSGDIPYQLCSATLLEVVNLSNNSLTGSIPPRFIYLNAFVLDLRANKLVGQIPEIFFSGNNFRTIRLSQNRLEGTLPRSLANCKNLEVLDLSENELEGCFPYWLDTLPNLQVLNLRSNKLRGLIDSSKKNNHPFPKLHIFDLSDNSFYGHLPAKYIANFVAMKDESRSVSQYMWANDSQTAPATTYQDSVTVVMKGFVTDLVRILTVFTTIDLSRNFFEGDIPELIGDLKALKGLNLSHNNLTGRIPSSLGNLMNLEWLDLSTNKLNGEIPRGLADLSWLCWLNLSDNQLVGPIPRSTQFDTFNHSFDGNPGLCGHPLPKECGINDPQSPPPTSPEDGEKKAQPGHWIEWKAVAMGYGCGISFGISAGYIMLKTRRLKWLVRKVERWLVRMVERSRPRKTNRTKKNAARGNHTRRSTGGQ